MLVTTGIQRKPVKLLEFDLEESIQKIRELFIFEDAPTVIYNNNYRGLKCETALNLPKN